MKDVLVVGANGMLGYDLVKVFREKGYNVTAATREDFDITKIEEVEKFFKDKEFDLVINSAAYTQVDKAEEEKELAFLINETGARNLAKITNKKNIAIVYISTDYVFDGTKKEPYEVTDKPNPINVYGESKLAGEIATQEENSQSYIVRTSWLYGQNGKNFVHTMLDLAKTKEEISVVNDQFGCPTWTVDLCKAIESVSSKNSNYGVYNICAVNSCSWFEFAREIFKNQLLDITVVPISSSEYVSQCSRPENSILKTSCVTSKWQESIKTYLYQSG